MVEGVAGELARLVEETAAELRGLDGDLVRGKPNPAKWSIQEILGHLVDSAANNHQRFVRAQSVDSLVFPKYEQDDWVRVQGYNQSPWPELVRLWQLYNRHLVQVILRIPEKALSVECRIGPYEPVSLGFLVEDYVAHMKHHLAQIDRIVAEVGG